MRRGYDAFLLIVAGLGFLALFLVATADGTDTATPAPTPRVAEVVPRAKLVKAVRARDAARAEVKSLRRTIATSPDAELALQVAGTVYGQSWTHMRSCWLSEGYRHGERYQPRIVRYNRAGSGASGPGQFMPGTWRSTPFGRFDIHNVFAQAMATAWMWDQGRRREWAGEGCK